jgi:hypothetical protein
MRFENCIGWRVNFSDPQNVRRAFLELTFADPQKLEELVKRVRRAWSWLIGKHLR